MSDNSYSISKTSFLKFEQCHKAFFLYKNHPYLRDKVSIDKQLTFKRGHDVGFFAWQLFAGGVDASEESKNVLQTAEKTKLLIQNKTAVIYEAAFIHNSVLILVDILHFNEGKYQAYEVKSSIKISENYLKDAYLQYYVLKNSLPDFDDLFLVSLNPDYILELDIEPKKLFRKRSVKQNAEKNLAYFEHQINAALLVLEQNVIPNIVIGQHCFRPYLCDFFGTCWKGHLSETSIFNLPFVGKTTLFEWFNSGIKNIEEIPESAELKANVLKIKASYLSKKPLINYEKINAFTAQVKLPVGAMDMEIWSPALPQIKGTKPFEQTPFLICLYDGTHQSHYFTENLEEQDRKNFAEKLIKLTKDYASILTYDKTMEVSVINGLIKKYPDLEIDLNQLKAKLLDVFDIFLNMNYYDPSFKNNFSLKVVSSVLLENINYPNISSGLEAMNCYEQYRLSETALEKENFKQELITYCGMDCLATFQLFKFLAGIGK